MRQRLRQFLTRAWLTFRETARQPLCLLLAASTVLATALIPLCTVYTFGEEGRLARDGGLAFHLAFGLILAAYAACSSLRREITDGTAASALSKPVGRSLFFLSTFAGVGGVILIFSACATLATLMAERVAERLVMSGAEMRYVVDIQTGVLVLSTPFVACLLAGWVNYWTRRAAPSSALGLLLALMILSLLVSACFERDGRWAPWDFRVTWRTLPASLLITLALIVLGAMALACSTHLDGLRTLAVCTAVFFLGLLSDHLFGRLADASHTARLLYGLIPNWQNFWTADFLRVGISAAYAGRLVAYGGSLLAGFLILGQWLFQRTEVH